MYHISHIWYMIHTIYDIMHRYQECCQSLQSAFSWRALGTRPSTPSTLVTCYTLCGQSFGDFFLFFFSFQGCFSRRSMLGDLFFFFIFFLFSFMNEGVCMLVTRYMLRGQSCDHFFFFSFFKSIVGLGHTDSHWPMTPWEHYIYAYVLLHVEFAREAALTTRGDSGLLD